MAASTWCFLIFLLQKGRRAFFWELLHVLRVYKVPPGKVLVIGAGVAGLSAIATVCPSDSNVHSEESKLTLVRPVDLVPLSEVLILAQPRVNKFNLLGPSFSKSLSRRKVAEQEVMPKK